MADNNIDAAAKRSREAAVALAIDLASRRKAGTTGVDPSLAGARLAEMGINLQAGARNEPLGNVANVREVLERHYRFKDSFWLDTFHQKMFTNWDCDEPRAWADVDRLAIADVLQGDMGLVKFTPELVEQAVQVLMTRNQRDSLKDWLTGLRWDEEPRLDTWLSRATGAPQDEYHTALGRNFILSMVARGLRPGCKVDTMPVFEGEQGVLKSTLLKTLGGDFYSELTESLDNKDFMVSIQGRWLVEIAELDAFKRSDVTRIKQVLSSQVDRFRPPYGRHAIDAPRRTVFAGTTNESHYLRDATGARRFWPLRVVRIDLDWLEENREQLFAEAAEIFRDGATWWEMPIEAHREQAEMRREDDAWEAAISDYCAMLSEVTLSDVLVHAVGLELAKQGRAEQMRAAKALSAVGYSVKVVKRGGKCLRVWARNSPAPDVHY
ncbi:VapE domain-containing protein [Caballeronia sp. 15715]|uniref:VapE domain-containing protein n=1 Tax=Caballeronia sp. 15715 TaxID=3391030 RepID=UPI0039E65839